MFDGGSNGFNVKVQQNIIDRSWGAHPDTLPKESEMKFVKLFTIQSIPSAQICRAPHLTTIHEDWFNQRVEKMNFDVNIVKVQLMTPAYKGV